ncbi:unnamed protein product [Schistosoma curassoni]|uniref:Uncharacterized protein n=1 Tax=Schistosoma curassoni TaxID=6186 RepID=A0A183L5T2_9TREM|nr:unnamed protein product [Schistosoma curassoni]
MYPPSLCVSLSFLKHSAQRFECRSNFRNSWTYTNYFK